MSSTSVNPVDFDALMKAHLAGVFNERDPVHRMTALKDLYTEDATFFEPATVVSGHSAISGAVDALQASMPPQFVFTALGPAVGHHGVARLRWSAGPPGGPAAVTGTDVAQFDERRIKRLHVFLDPEPG